MNCFSQTLPFVLGSTDQDTVINSMALGSDYSIAYGGYSSSSIFGGTSANSQPFIGYQTYGGQQQYLSQVNSGTQFKQVVAVIISFDLQIYFAFDASPLTIGILDLYDINTIKGFQLGQSSSSSLSLVDGGMAPHLMTNKYMIFGMTSQTSQWQVLTFNISSGGTNAIMGYSTNAGFACTVIAPWDDISAVLVGGYITGTNNHVYASVTSISASTMIPYWQQGIDQSINPSNYFYVRRLSIKTNIFGCAQAAPTLGDLLFFSIPLDGSKNATGFSQVYSYSITSAMQCIDIFAYSSSHMYALVFEYTNGNSVLLSIESGSTSINYYNMDSMAGSGGSMKDGVIFNGHTGLSILYAGSTKQIKYVSPVKSYSFFQGFITSELQDSTCQIFTYTDQAYTMNSGSSLAAFNENINVINPGAWGFNSISSLSAAGNLTSNPSSAAGWCKPNSIITISYPSISDQQCYANSSVYINDTAVSGNTSVCDDISTVGYDLYKSDNQSKVPSYMDFSHRYITCNHVSLAQSTTEVYDLQIYSPNYQIINIHFNVVYEDPCQSSTILSASNQVNQTYRISEAMIQMTIANFSITGQFDPSYCFIDDSSFAITVSPTNSSIAAAIYLSKGILKVDTTDYSLIGNYSVTIFQSMNINNYTFNATMNVEILDNCDSAYIFTQAINSSLYYDIMENQNRSLDYAKWNESVTYCETKYPINYTLYQYTAAPFISMASPKNILIYTTNISDVGNYSMGIYGIMTSLDGVTYNSTQLNFTVVVMNLCPTCLINTGNFNPSSYTIGQGLLNQTFTDWLPTPSYCLNASYSTYFTSDTEINNVSTCINTTDNTILANQTSCGNETDCNCTYSLVSSTLAVTKCMNMSAFPFITFENTTRTFSIYTTNVSHAGNYNLTIYGIFPNGSHATSNITFTLIDPCPTANLTDTISPIQIYTLQNNWTTINSQNITSNVSNLICGNWTYIYDFGLLDNSTLIYSNDSATFQIQSFDQSMAGKYTITVLAYQGNYKQYNNITVTFNLTIIDPCRTISMTAPNISNQLYNISDTQQNITFAAFTYNLSICGSFSYSLTYQNGSKYDASIFTFDPVTQEITIHTDDPTKIGTYNMQLNGTLPYSYGTELVNFTVTIQCLVRSISPTSDSKNYTYLVGDSQLSIQWSPFVQWPACGNTFTYYLQPMSGTFPNSLSKLPSSFNFKQASSTLNLYTNGLSDIGIYDIAVNGTLNDKNKTSAVCLEYIILLVSNPPRFISSLQDLVIYVNTKVTYTFPKAQNDQGQTAKVTVFLGTLTFITFDSYSINLKMKPTYANLGVFYVTVVVADSIYGFLSTQYTLQVTVLRAPSSSLTGSTIHSQTNSTNNDNSTSSNETDAFAGVSMDQQQQLSLSNNKKPIINTETMVPSNLSQDQLLIPSINSISKKGLITIDFSKDVIIPSNYSHFNSSILKLTIIPSASSNISSLAFNWTITDFTKSTMSIQLQFENPLEVSKYDPDKISIKFLQIKYFQVNTTHLMIQQYYTLKTTLPCIMLNDSKFFSFINIAATKIMTAFAGPFNSFMNSVAISNMVLNIFLAASLQYVWGMINCLQIIVNIPLLNIQMPSNSVYMYSLLINFITLNVIPTNTLFSKTFNFTDTGAYNSNFQNMGYTSRNIIENLGSNFLYLIGIVITYFLHIAFKLLKDKARINVFTAIFAIASSAILLLFPIFTSFFLLINFKKLSDASFKAKYETLYDRIKIESRIGVLFSFIFVLRRFLYCITIFYFHDTPIFQLQLLLLQCVSVLVYLGLYKPYIEPINNYLEMFNEFSIITIAYHLCIFTDFVPDSALQYKMGWSVIVFTIFNLLVNTIVIIFMTFGKLKLLLTKYWKEYQRRRSKKYGIKSDVDSIKNFDQTDISLEGISPKRFQGNMTTDQTNILNNLVNSYKDQSPQQRSIWMSNQDRSFSDTDKQNMFKHNSNKNKSFKSQQKALWYQNSKEEAKSQIFEETDLYNAIQTIQKSQISPPNQNILQIKTSKRKKNTQSKNKNFDQGKPSQNNFISDIGTPSEKPKGKNILWCDKRNQIIEKHIKGSDIW